jgi:hypothetical protein
MLVSVFRHEEKTYPALDCYKENPDMARVNIRESPTLLLCFLVGMAVAASAVAADGNPTFTFRCQRKPGQTDRVRVLLEVGGETKYVDDGKPKRDKMSVACNLDYVEKTLEAPADADGVCRSLRDYQVVSVVVKVGDGQFEPRLRPDRCLIGAEAAKQTTLLFAPAGCLTRDELDVIDIQGNSLLVDRMLPDKPVSVGDRWEHSEQLMAALLGLDEVAKSSVQSTLKEVTDSVARFEFTGQVEGAIYGVSTKVEVKGKYRFDLRTKRIDWFAMLFQADWDVSFVADGMDAGSRLQMTITPVEEPSSLADAALAKLASKPTDELKQLIYESPDGGWQFEHDRRWHLHHQHAESTAAVLRLLNRGMPLGQCKLSSLPRREPDKLVSLAEFQDDVRQALGKSFGEFIEVGQSSNEANHSILRVVAHGTSSDIPMRWIYYLVTDSQGRQVAFTFAIEQELIERFADADKPLVGSLRFIETKKTEKAHREETDRTETKRETK